MYDIQAVFDDCMMKVQAIGLNPGRIVSVRVNNRFSACFGKCITTTHRQIVTSGTHRQETMTRTHKIEIAAFILRDSVPYSVLENTMFHEILHTCENCQDHGMTWQAYADRVNHAYNQNVRTYATGEDLQYCPARNRPDQFKYIVECDDCGRKWASRKKRQCYDYLNLCSCPHCKTHNLTLRKNY